MADNKVKFLRGTSNEYAAAEKDSDTIYFTTDNGKLYIGDKEVSGSDITIDTALSDTSENPVQNKVVKQAIDNKADKTVATTSADGLMSAEDKGKLDNANDTYALKSKYGDTTINVGRKAETDVGEYSTAEGHNTTASGGASHAEGLNTIASGAQSHAEGVETIASGSRSHAEGIWTIASGGSNHAEGKETTANGNNSCHAEGSKTTASGISTHAEGNSSNKVTDLITDFSWNGTTNDDIINVWNTQKFSIAHGRSSHVEGSDNLSLGHSSHAEGHNTVAIGNQSHTSGIGTKALHENEAAYGKYNESNEDTLFSIGDGTADDARHNAFEITTTGGKLHDKNIVTDDMSLPANGGNADTLDGLHAADFANAYNDYLGTYLAGKSGDIRELAYLLPTGGLWANTKFPELENITFPIEGDILITWDKSKYIQYGYIYGVLTIRPMTSTGDTYICSVYNTTSYTDWQKISDGGNADTLDGLHSTDFVNANIGQIQIPSNVDVPMWIASNGKRYQQYMTNGGNVGLTNVPNNAGDYVWYWHDGVNIIAREWVTGRYYICDTINGGFSGWKDVYTSGFKPYVTGEVTGTSGSAIITTNHGFTPSAVFWWMISQGRTLHSAYSFDTTSFTLPSSLTSDALVNYIIFR